jgi:hypothetical protein
MEAKEANGTNGHSTALTVRSAPNLSAYEPSTPAEAYEMAKHFAGSKLLGELGTPDQVFLIMATGHDLKIPPTTALRAISIVKGKPVLSADLMKAMCISRKDVCEHFRLLKSDPTIATYSAKRVGEPAVELSFTMEDAQRAKLSERGSDKSDNNYSKYPAVMLRHRCVAMLAREVFPDIIAGVYCEEEAQEMNSDPRPPAREPIPAAEVLDAETVEQPREQPREESIEDALTRWTMAFRNATTIEECDKIAVEAHRRGLSAEDLNDIKNCYGEAKKRIKAAA